MALSMDEQRILTEIASQLSDDDPRLAQRLSTFGRVRRHRRRIRRVAVLVVVVAAIATALTAAITIALS
ncbi:MAG: DUF3040 domain-containing protein [Actinomadura sp.]